jgi:ribose/xylose/arabinose/galactoside ABC-type transport system permease subunit
MTEPNSPEEDRTNSVGDNVDSADQPANSSQVPATPSSAPQYDPNAQAWSNPAAQQSNVEPYPAEYPTRPLPESEPANTQVMEQPWATQPGTPVPPLGGEPTVGTHRAKSPKDRYWPHFIWEAILAIAVVITAWQVHQDHSNILKISEGNDFWLGLASLTLLASGFALSLRAGVPNLAIGAVATTSVIITYWLMIEHDFKWGIAVPTAAVLALAFGALVGAFIGLLRVPAWFATLGAIAFCIGIGVLISDKYLEEDSEDIGNLSEAANLPKLPDATKEGLILFIIIALLSIMGGIIWLSPRIRTYWTVQNDSDTTKRSGTRIVASVAALAGSSLLAALSGTLAAMSRPKEDFALYGLLLGPFSGGFPSFVVSVEIWVIVAVVVGGVSIFGRKGGVFGTVLGTSLATLFLFEVEDWKLQNVYFLLAAAFAVGLIVSRLVEVVSTRRNELTSIE